MKRYIRKILFYLVERKYSKLKISSTIGEILKGRGYIESIYKGKTIFALGFVFVIIEKDLVRIGCDTKSKRILKPNTLNIPKSNLAELVIALNYHETLN